MTTGKNSALGAVRYGLLAGLSAAALILAASSAQAQDAVVVTGGATGEGLLQNGQALESDTTNVAITGIGVTDGALASTTLTSAAATVTDGTATSTLTSTAITSGGTLTSAGALTVSGGGAAITGNSTVTGTLGVSGALSATGAGTGLAVTNDATIGGTLTVTGATTFAGGIDMGGAQLQNVGTPIAATDATNKAYVDRGVNKAYEGTALALAISQPMFQPGQSFAVRAGWGNFENQNAFGASAAGVLGRDVLGYGSTLVVDAGVGVGGTYNTVAAKAGLTLGFGGGYAPMK